MNSLESPNAPLFPIDFQTAPNVFRARSFSPFLQTLLLWSTIMREIATVQVGGFANFISSHFWNSQDEMLGLASLWRSNFQNSESKHGCSIPYRLRETVMLICVYELEYMVGSLGSASSKGILYDKGSSAPSEVVTWRFLSNGCGILETISDEYTNTPVLLYAVRGPSSVMNPSSRKHTVVRDLHDAVSFSRLSFFGKMTILVCPSLGVKPQLSSTLKMRIPYAVALHSTSLPSRIPLGPTADSSDVSGAVYISGSVKMLAAGQSRQNMVAILDVARPNPSLTVMDSRGFASRGSLDVHSIPVAARIRYSCAMLPFLKNRFGNLYRIGIQPWSPGTELLRSWGFGKDVGETLSKMISIVNPRYEISYYSD
ncbi:hypothetical protein V6N11_058456 [Hibiscus sabdariffa]|uniref:Misato Segment II tubulin-like domain-containing protein n=1 Tax=Hibiscus sabdariffa TaxID=183260 RepID=A0ABR2U530_9ROSI